ncbi:methyltransferase [Methylomicrobium sp. Wu6]|uniref:tRNA1(Val) (adenine(37)-N6)-methyltransferase n=1 Tax=Methylomicrobium sp. Wu6 TaxID=3107928 RepID=UPI002DD6B994|nr:methyltransferase [Methylomicrobium sp. Wu6]MEC4750245.1 methyltransferase [Methylomicrobium sp. Wu6]
MKICTDSLLFGTMMPVKPKDKVLDIGAGTGLLSLIAAQFGAGSVTGVELMEDACREAAENFERSPWSDRLKAVRQSIQNFADEETGRYNLIVSNPPFFENHLHAKEPMRNAARHDGHLKHAELIKIAEQLLAGEGSFYVLLPIQSVSGFIRMCLQSGLYLRRQTALRGYAHSAIKVTALTFGRMRTDQPVFETMTIYDAQGVYSAASRAYLADFLLRFAAHENPKVCG